jgi:hypothetical protein
MFFKCSCKNHQVLWWNWLSRGPPQERKTEFPLLQRISSLELTAPQIAAHINASQSLSNRHISTSTVQRGLHESVLRAWIAAYNCSASARKALPRVVRMAQYITGAKLPAIQDLYARWSQRKALHIIRDSSPRAASGTGAPGLGLKSSLTASTPKP